MNAQIDQTLVLDRADAYIAHAKKRLSGADIIRPRTCLALVYEKKELPFLASSFACAIPRAARGLR